MCHRFLRDARLYGLLLQVDRDLAQQTQAAGCRRCNGRLDIANYPRKPRGGLVDAGVEFGWRFSFCCYREGCRSRATPPSVRYLGRKVYLGAVVALITALRQGPTPPAAKRLKAELGIDRRTLERWQAWWQELFPQGEFWAQARPQLFPHCPADDTLPRSLLKVFGAQRSIKRLVRSLRFLSPASTPLAVAVHASLWPT
jgi:hypothetical protein